MWLLRAAELTNWCTFLSEPGLGPGPASYTLEGAADDCSSPTASSSEAHFRKEPFNATSFNRSREWSAPLQGDTLTPRTVLCRTCRSIHPGDDQHGGSQEQGQHGLARVAHLRRSSGNPDRPIHCATAPTLADNSQPSPTPSGISGCNGPACARPLRRRLFRWY